MQPHINTRFLMRLYVNGYIFLEKIRGFLASLGFLCYICTVEIIKH
jgi:hypothetical protein